MPRKVALHIIQDLDVAGAQTVVMNYLRWMDSDPEVEIRVAVLGHNKHSAYSEECTAKDYNVTYYNYSPWLKVPVIRSVVNWLKLNRIVKNAIKENHPDIIHSHQTSIIPYICLPFYFSRIKKRFHTLHSDPYAITSRHASWARFAFRHCGIRPVCVTQQQAEKAIARYGIVHFDIVRNGLDETEYQLPIVPVSVKRELGIVDEVTVIGSVGRFSKIKNFAFLLKVFAAYHEKHQNTILLLVGDGEERTHIETLAQDLGIRSALLLTGQRNDVARLYKVMDVFMLTSFFESSSIVTVEAQLSGVRCVVADSIPADVVISKQVNRISLEAPVEKWVEGMEGKIPFETTVYPSSQFTKEGVIEKLKTIYVV